MDWYNFIRDVCAQYFLDHPTTIGGDWVEVEIDESKFGKRKYHHGRYVEGLNASLGRASWWKLPREMQLRFYQ